VQFIRRHSDEQLLAELRRVAAAVPGVLTKALFDQHSQRATSATIFRRFGSWRPALTAAGLGDRSAHRTVTPRPGRLRSPHLTDELLIAELQKVADRVGSGTITMANVRKHSEVMGVQVLVSRFGSFGAACAAAGLQPAKRANRWTDEDFATNFRLVERHLGRTPIRADMDRPPSTISSGSYVYRYGSWQAAVASFTTGHTTESKKQRTRRSDGLDNEHGLT
jgi:hypothetical protein